MSVVVSETDVRKPMAARAKEGGLVSMVASPVSDSHSARLFQGGVVVCYKLVPRETCCLPGERRLR
jgi:hypothetical protein